MFKTISAMKKNDERGFTLIELLIVVAIIGILAAIAIPGYLGMQERGRKGGVIRVSESSMPELQGWINSAKKAGTVQEGLTEVDSDGDGAIVAGTDTTNLQLSTAGIVTTWLAAHAVGTVGQAVSPWNSANPLWNTAAGATLALCETAAAANLGQISLCATPAEDSTITQMHMVAVDNSGNTIFRKTISAD